MSATPEHGGLSEALAMMNAGEGPEFYAGVLDASGFGLAATIVRELAARAAAPDALRERVAVRFETEVRKHRAPHALNPQAAAGWELGMARAAFIVRTEPELLDGSQP